ncbi:MAG TPA: type II toxin-antitoxin system ParD family antitoxin [Tepidisphaeraceae bacterium]|nr:type II toxin-antitoxin system ParD family antitoxin [Tepidisphaeraceae bacterium]
MTLTLPPEVEKLIDESVQSGKYRSAEEFVTAAIYWLAFQDDFTAAELERLLAEGENSGPPLDGESVLRELRDKIAKGVREAETDAPS